MGRKEEFLKKELASWREEQLIDDTTLSLLTERYSSKRRWDLQTLIKWFLWIGATSLGIGMIGVVTAMLVSAGFLAGVLSLSGTATVVFGIALTRPRFRWHLPRTGNALVIVGCLLLGGAVFALARFLSPDGDHWSVLMLILAALYAIVAYATKNPVVLVLTLLSLATWFGAETGYASGWGAYYLGLNYPVRFALVSPLVVAVGYFHARWGETRFPGFSRVYYALGLLYLSLALWIMSIWGPGRDMLMGSANAHLTLAMLSLLWLVVSFAMFLAGTRFSDRMFRGFGITFIILNLYTRFFEYFWDEMDKYWFFIVLGAVTLIVGIVIERRQRTRKRDENGGQ
jgi:uncharacterized membrane protein